MANFNAANHAQGTYNTYICTLKSNLWVVKQKCFKFWLENIKWWGCSEGKLEGAMQHIDEHYRIERSWNPKDNCVFILLWILINFLSYLKNGHFYILQESDFFILQTHVWILYCPVWGRGLNLFIKCILYFILFFFMLHCSIPVIRRRCQWWSLDQTICYPVLPLNTAITWSSLTSKLQDLKGSYTSEHPRRLILNVTIKSF